MKTVIKKFQELTTNELYKIISARESVFVVEQSCAYLDADGLDTEAYHIYIEDGGEILAYLRVLDKGVRYDEVSISRVITVTRGVGLGKKLITTAKEVAKDKYGATLLKVGAQTRAREFYEKCGFVATKEPEYVEDGIPHVYMTCII